MSLLSALTLSRAPASGFAALGFMWGCFAALAPQIKSQIGADDRTFGLLLLATAIGLSSTIWLAPRFDARLRRLSLPIAGVMLGLAFFLPGHATMPLQFFLCMLLVGMCSGLMDVVMNARVSELEAVHTRSLMSANHGMFSLLYACGALATGVAREVGLDPAIILSTAGMIAVCASFLMVSNSWGAGAEGADTTLPLPGALVLLCGGIVLVAYTAEAAVESWSALHIERTLGGRAAQGAMGPALLGITMTIGRFFGQGLSERFSERLLIEIAGVVTILGTLIVALAPTPLVAYLGFTLLGLGVSIIGPLGIALMGRLAPPHLRTAAIARVSIIGFLGFMIAPAMMGLIADAYGLRVAFLAIGGVLATLPVLTLTLLVRYRA